MSSPFVRPMKTDFAEESGIDYPRQWRAFAVRWFAATGLFIAWPVISFLLFYESRHSWHEPLFSLAAMFVWLAAALAAVWWQGEFRCPRCRRRYGALGSKSGDTNYTRGFFDKVCANCKLRKFEHG